MPALADFGPLAVRGKEITRQQREKASQTFKAGSIVMMTSGLVELAAAAGNPVAASKVLCGIALQDASGTTDALIQILMFHDGMEVLLPVLDSSTVASSITSKTDVDVWYELFNETTGGWMVDISETTDNYVKATEIILGFMGEDTPIGTLHGAYWCQFPAFDDAGTALRIRVLG